MMSTPDLSDGGDGGGGALEETGRPEAEVTDTGPASLGEGQEEEAENLAPDAGTSATHRPMKVSRLDLSLRGYVT